MKLVILGEGEREFAESVAYYESKEPGLGRRFRDEVVQAAERIARYRRARAEHGFAGAATPS